jgi:hypothetical protein
MRRHGRACPGRPRLGARAEDDVDGRDKPGHDDGTEPLLRSAQATKQSSDAGNKFTRRKKFFIIFVDRKFTTSFARLFTNVFEVTGVKPAMTCLYRACNAD